MAIYHCTTKPISRSKGRSAVAAAAYRAGESIEDQRTGITHDYTRRQGVIATLALLPNGERCERDKLWNAAELAEKPKNARTAREWVIALPNELDAQQRLHLTTRFATELAERYGVAVDMAIHAPDQSGDQRNHHAHILTTTREVVMQDDQWTLGNKATLELSDKKRGELQLGRAREEIKNVRATWADIANQYLAREGHEARIDHRTLKEQGIDRTPTIHLGPAATEMERKGKTSERGTTNREVRQLEADIIDLQVERQRRLEQARERWIQKYPHEAVANYQAQYQTIRNQIGQRAEFLGHRLGRSITQLNNQHYQHLQAEPPEPKGLLGHFRKPAYAHWLQEKHRMEKRLEQLHKRYDLVWEYRADGPYKYRGDDLAGDKMRARFPQLARDRERADRIIARQREIQLQQRELERQRRRTRYRGLGR